MHKPSNGVVRVLVCRAQARLCGLPLDAVEETLRPQPLRPLAAPVVHVAGLARIRGDWLPVVDLAGLLGMSPALTAGAPLIDSVHPAVTGTADDAAAVPVRRYVVLRVGERRVALAVAEVLGVFELPEAEVRALPPLLRDREHGAVAALAERDDELVAVLDQARLLPDATLTALATPPAGLRADTATDAPAQGGTAR